MNYTEQTPKIEADRFKKEWLQQTEALRHNQELALIDATEMSGMTIEQINGLSYFTTTESFSTAWHVSAPLEQSITINYLIDRGRETLPKEQIVAYHQVIHTAIHTQLLALGYQSNADKMLTEYNPSVGNVNVTYSKNA